MDKQHLSKLGILLVYFCILAVLFYYLTPGYVILPILVASAIIWYAVEYKKNEKDLRLLSAAFFMGLFLMIFDFAVENIGGSSISGEST